MGETARQEGQLCASLTDPHVFVRYGSSNITDLIKSMILCDIESEHDVSYAKKR